MFAFERVARVQWLVVFDESLLMHPTMKTNKIFYEKNIYSLVGFLNLDTF